jgi:TPR repeat protein
MWCPLYRNYPQTELAWRYAQGKGCRVDQAKATEWFEKSAGQGYPEAMFVLGWRKINGEGTSVDEAKGIELYMKAAARGVSQAQYNMALRFEEGRGVPKDDGKALKYYTQVGPCRSYTPILKHLVSISAASVCVAGL